MTLIADLSEKDKAKLISFITNFKVSYERYFNNLRNSLTLEDILHLYDKGEWTEEDIFMEYINSLSWDNDTIYFWEDNMEKYDFCNYFPLSNKLLSEGGSWIKVRSETGFELHFAKISSRKRNWKDLLNSSNKKLISLMNKIKETEITTLDLKSELKKKDLFDKLKIENKNLIIRSSINLNPYEVRIKTSKSKVRYLLPYEYELIDDINLYMESYIRKTPGLTFRKLYTSLDEPKIFYLRSRGIPKELSEMISVLNSGYFIVDMEVILKEYNNQFRNQITFINEHSRNGI